MNTSLGYRDIYGEIDEKRFSMVTKEIFKLIAEIRVKLGKQNYLLDKYLGKLLEGMSAFNTLEACERARRLSCRFKELVSAAMCNRDYFNEHPFYETARQYIADHPLDYQEEETCRNIYIVTLLDDFLETETEIYRKKLKQILFDIFNSAEAERLAYDIGRLTGNEDIELLNLYLRQRFLLVTPMVAFAQGMTDELLLSLVYRDDETGKTVAQLWRDAVGDGG